MFENDITKCANEECKIKNSCFRYTCKPDSHWQSYAIFNTELNDICDFFIDNKNVVA
ncbi:MAG: hypothetical protein WCS33_00115 [Candidatus Caldatribacteriota bacterium]